METCQIKLFNTIELQDNNFRNKNKRIYSKEQLSLKPEYKDIQISSSELMKEQLENLEKIEAFLKKNEKDSTIVIKASGNPKIDAFVQMMIEELGREHFENGGEKINIITKRGE